MKKGWQRNTLCFLGGQWLSETAGAHQSGLGLGEPLVLIRVWPWFSGWQGEGLGGNFQGRFRVLSQSIASDSL